MILTGEALVSGKAAGPLLRIDHPISFWGGVDPKSARITDPRHPQHAACLTGRVVAIAALRGSSSSSAVLLELIHARLAPAAILLQETDAILALGALVAREMGYGTLPMARLSPEDFSVLTEASQVEVSGGQVRVSTSKP